MRRFNFKHSVFKTTMSSESRVWESQERMKRRTEAELPAWIEQLHPVTRETLLGAFETWTMSS